MRILKVISLLLDYPDQHLRDGHAELAQAIGAAREISPAQRIALRRLLDELTEGDLMDVQERYTDLFDRGRALSLLLFEHVHGESRDRGQAMVDLMAQYTEAGFDIGVRELPDYIPLYLEYLATCEDLEAREGLADVSHLLALLAARLQERESPHAACFGALLQIAGEPVQETLAAHPCRAGRARPARKARCRCTGPISSMTGRPPRSPRRCAMSNFNFLLFGAYPYIALAICLIGSWARFDLSQYSWKAGSSQMLSNNRMRLASNLFHVGILFILAGHFVGLLMPEALYHSFITSGQKQIVAMVSGGFFGILCLIGLSMLIRRRLTDARVRATSSSSDIMILFVLLAQLVLGLLTIVASTGHLDGSVMVLLGTWAQSLVTLQPVKAAGAIESVGIIYKLHVFLGVTLFVLFPFTRLVHIVSAPVWYLGRRYQIVRQKGVKPAMPRPQRPRTYEAPARETSAPTAVPGYATAKSKTPA